MLIYTDKSGLLLHDQRNDWHSKSIVCCIVIKVSELITEILWEEHAENFFRKTVEEFRTAMLDMESEWKFPFEFSAIDGSHLPIKCPERRK